MLDATFKSLINLRGALRFEQPKPPPVRKKDFELSTEKHGEPEKPEEPSWLKDSRKLIPGEALTGYIGLQSLAALAKNPENVRIVLAIVFCVVTIILSWVGTQDPKSPKPSTTTEFGVVLISTASYIALVYATGGQLYWHETIPDQTLYAQIVAAALGILGPPLYRNVFYKPPPAST
jgi:hypothetical protein